MNRKQRRAESKASVPVSRAALSSVQGIFADALRQYQSGQMNEAERLCRYILQIDSCHAEALHLLGVLAHADGRHDMAVELFGKAIARNARMPAYHSNLGNALQALGKLDEAMAAYGQAIAQKPDYAVAHYNLGFVFQGQGKFDAAVESYGRAIAYKPDHARAHRNLGVALQTQGKMEAALASYGRAIAYRPDDAETHFNLGNALVKLGRLDDAVESYGQALTHRPHYAEAHLNLGNTYKELGRLEDAAASYGRALAHKPDYVQAHYNLGKTLKSAGQRDAEVAAYGRALAHDPDFAEAHYSLALLYLQSGNFDEGWREFEWRWRLKSVTKYWRDFGAPRWGGDPLDGRTILLYAEQGMGDTIQFCRYVSMVAAGGGRVVLEVHRPLVRLLSGLAGVVRIIAKDDPLPPFDLHCPLLSLPQIFGTCLETIPAPVPYLTAEPQRVVAWRERLPKSERRIGIVWQGSPTYKDDRNRSIPLACFAPLARVPGVKLISLQKLHGLDQLERLPDGMDVATLGADFDEGSGAFLDAAAVMMSLDLIITVDTAIGHLAGAMGLPVWLPLAANPHWVWMLGRDDTPWYPKTCLFRQSTPGDWDGVIAAMAEALG